MDKTLKKKIKVDECLKIKLVIVMDMHNWEQDGSGPVFVDITTGNRKKFKSWLDVYDFAMELAAKKKEET